LLLEVVGVGQMYQALNKLAAVAVREGCFKDIQGSPPEVLIM
jgi:hypothetical protein